MRTKEYIPLDPEDERLAALIVDSAFAVHKNLGPGLLESIYEVCLCHELEKRAVSFKRQVIVPLVYEGITFHKGLQLDVIVGGRIICELKSVAQTLPVHLSQVLTYLKLSGNRLGFLINFNVPVIKHGIKRIIL
jgi:GxxExxY protein